MSVCLAYMTFKDSEEARKIGTKLLEEGLIACFNLFPVVESFYLWKGALESGKEVVALAKLKEEDFSSLVDLVCQHHSYETPCVLRLPVTGGHEPFLQWVEGP